MYHLVYGFLYLLSLLPLRALYIFGDAVYGLVYYVLGYRKEVVMNNLRIAFPEKSEQERKLICKKFYHNFIDNFIETSKMLSAPKSFFLERFKGDVTVLNELYSEGLRCLVHL